MLINTSPNSVISMSMITQQYTIVSKQRHVEINASAYMNANISLIIYEGLNFACFVKKSIFQFSVIVDERSDWTITKESNI